MPAAQTRSWPKSSTSTKGEPILVRKRFVLDVNDTPVEYNIGYYRADSFTYSIEFING